MAKLRIGLLFGGRSVEHEVSIASATSILEALDPSRYDISLIAVDADGQWHLGSPALPPEASTRGDEVSLPAIPGTGGLVSAGDAKGALTTPMMSSRGCPFQCVFCNVPHSFRTRSATHVVDEME